MKQNGYIHAHITTTKTRIHIHTKKYTHTHTHIYHIKTVRKVIEWHKEYTLSLLTCLYCLSKSIRICLQKSNRVVKSLKDIGIDKPYIHISNEYFQECESNHPFERQKCKDSKFQISVCAFCACGYINK